jgi:hypothetical protein
MRAPLSFVMVGDQLEDYFFSQFWCSFLFILLSMLFYVNNRMFFGMKETLRKRLLKNNQCK